MENKGNTHTIGRFKMKVKQRAVAFQLGSTEHQPVWKGNGVGKRKEEEEGMRSVFLMVPYMRVDTTRACSPYLPAWQCRASACVEKGSERGR